MPKIIKHTFEIPNLKIVDGELIDEGVKKETYTFTLMHKGIRVYEELAHEPLIKTLAQFDNIDDVNQIGKLMGSEFLLNLASASYVKIEGDKFHNNRATAEEFKKLPISNHLDDLGFVLKLIQMAVECVVGDIPAQEKELKKVNKFANKHVQNAKEKK